MRTVRLLLVVLAAWPVAAAGQGAARAYELAGHGTLELTVPRDWTEQVERPARDGPPTITFRPRSGDAFRLVLTAGWSPTGQPQPAARLRETIEQAGRAMLPQAVERQLTVQELRGAAGTGYYFSLTDRAPQAGEYSVVTQGMLGVGDVVVAFTLLYRDAQGPERDAALTVLRSTQLRAAR